MMVISIEKPFSLINRLLIYLILLKGNKMENQIVNSIDVVSSAQIIEKNALAFNCLAKKTAESILEMGRIVFETKKKLGLKSLAYSEFCARISFEPESSALKKLNQIGKSYAHLRAQAENLPINWTTIYEISRLTEVTFNEMLEAGEIHQNVLGSAIKKLIEQTKPKKLMEGIEIADRNEQKEEVQNGTPNGYAFVAELTTVSDVVLKAHLSKILKDLRELGVTLKISPALKSALKPVVALAA